MLDPRGGPSGQDPQGSLPPYVWPGSRHASGVAVMDYTEGEQQRFSGAGMYYGQGGDERAGGDFGHEGGMGLPPYGGYGDTADMASMKSGSSGRMRGYRRGGPIIQHKIHMNLVQKPARAYAAKQEATIRDLKRRGYELY